MGDLREVRACQCQYSTTNLAFLCGAFLRLTDLSDPPLFVTFYSKSVLFLLCCGAGGEVEGELLFSVVPLTPVIFNITFQLFSVFY